MSDETLPLFAVHRVEPHRFAEAQRRLFVDMRMRIGSSSTVHAVGKRPWINGLTLPAPACGQGWSGLGAAGELHPTTHTVSCRRCERLVGGPSSIAQAALFELPG